MKTVRSLIRENILFNIKKLWYARTDVFDIREPAKRRIGVVNDCKRSIPFPVDRIIDFILFNGFFLSIDFITV